MCKKRGRLSVAILKKIEPEGLDVKNCREQSYDNGENMAASTISWEVLLKYSPLALKKESDTLWSSRREAVTVVRKHLDKIVEALNHLPLDAVSSPEAKSVSVSLLKSIQTFEFIAFTCFWQKT
ncbi:hypothetical protein AVEN_134089-1 [Araneus ventricosus]|uniref:Uncharacterized protein n=1 Tax=Araneus ventricosus TaxID=182803 RepID=A0A4Y2NQ14_ARAVE|nr:hypothetical protein AVEN_134089-1 [Araneus ventricosus]